ncbi:MAG: phosphoribosylformylglycinamidine synthase subunit PurL [Bryobacterales bacterium]|nr:phosphoribosylformylglycinamidine synthase subunit PurL [Bryobacteraceae bacterium]MDW8129425.1 phosphoribosylformylglycinamidine synthase subunit PurL [Bryobacterales bacterium]
MTVITPELVAAHQLTTDEYERILRILGRPPTYTELGIFSVMWSEHCSYKSSRLHLRKLPTEGPYVLQGPGENAGVIDIGGGYAAAFKIESHNHPSFIEPFQGAATGVGGILRDIFTMGARPIAVMDSLRFGPLDHPRAGPRNRRILEGVVSGIAHYGNCFGVPTVGGECVFEPCYNGNPLVNVFALGIVRQDRIFYARACGIGNPVVYVGAKTGRDGIHGASMASAEFTEESRQKRPNVQVGDPFMEKLLLEACLEAMETGAVVGIQDMGAAGLTCSTCEMGSRGGTGVEIELARVPQREAGMTPYEIMLSESQERMLLVIERGREEEVFRIFRKWGLDAVAVGEVTGDGLLRVKHHGEIVAEIPSRALADEAPMYDRPRSRPFRTAPMDGPDFESQDLTRDLVRLLASGDLCDKRWIWEQYDYMVRTNTVLGPGSDAAVLRVKETGTSLAMALDGNGRYCYLDPRQGTRLAVAECCRNVSTVGALPVAATNCLNFGNPERPEIMAQLVEAIEGMGEACAFFGTPITGGNVSLYNETLGEAIYPTPVVGIVGLMRTGPPVKLAFQSEQASVLLLGGLGSCDARQFGATQYAKVILGELWGLPPALDMEHERRVQAAVREIVSEGLAESSHDVSDGGLAVALAECSLGGVGAEVDLPGDLRPEFLLFHEGPSRIVLSTRRPEAVERIAARHGVEALRLGATRRGVLRIRQRGRLLVDCEVGSLVRPWASALEQALRG